MAVALVLRLVLVRTGAVPLWALVSGYCNATKVVVFVTSWHDLSQRRTYTKRAATVCGRRFKRAQRR